MSRTMKMLMLNNTARCTVGLLLFAVFAQGCKKASDNETVTLVTVQAEKPETGEISEHIVADATLTPD